MMSCVQVPGRRIGKAFAMKLIMSDLMAQAWQKGNSEGCDIYVKQGMFDYYYTSGMTTFARQVAINFLSAVNIKPFTYDGFCKQHYCLLNNA